MTGHCSGRLGVVSQDHWGCQRQPPGEGKEDTCLYWLVSPAVSCCSMGVNSPALLGCSCLSPCFLVKIAPGWHIRNLCRGAAVRSYLQDLFKIYAELVTVAMNGKRWGGRDLQLCTRSILSIWTRTQNWLLPDKTSYEGETSFISKDLSEL